MVIEVTQQDIEDGLPEHLFKCPIGRALTRITGIKCLVTGYSIYIGDKKYDTPIEASNFLRNFDEGIPVYPFRFTL